MSLRTALNRPNNPFVHCFHHPGLLYLIVHGPDGGYYRYPYYGEYYRHYYHPWYRPYTGFYPEAAPVIVVAPLIVGAVLGIVIINNLQYVLSRDASGHLYRYPYYGPYRQVYYRPTYAQYRGPYVTNGAYRNAPVRQGDPRWDTDRRNLTPAAQQPQRQYQPQQRPTQQPQQRPTQQPRRPTQQRPNPKQNGGRPDGGGGNSRQTCGQPQQPPCPSTQHP